MSEEWKRVHVRQFQYCLQILKCKNIECYLSFWFKRQVFTTTDSSYKNCRRFKVSTKWCRGRKLFQSLSIFNNEGFISTCNSPTKVPKVPYDYSNHAVEENVIKKRTLSYLQLYFGAIKSKETHQILCNSWPKYKAIIVQEKQIIDVSETCEAERPIRPTRIKTRWGVDWWYMTLLVSLIVTLRNLLFGVFLPRKVITILQK